MNLATLVAAVGAVVILGDAIAQTPSVFNACVKNDDGNMRFVAAPPCKANETLITWNRSGPTGPQGPAGPQGAQGLQGPTGSQGPAGDSIGWAYMASNGAILYPGANAESVLIPGPNGALALARVRGFDTTSGRVEIDFVASVGSPYGDKFYRIEDCAGVAIVQFPQGQEQGNRMSLTRRNPAFKIVQMVAAVGDAETGRFRSIDRDDGLGCVNEVNDRGSGSSLFRLAYETVLDDAFPTPIRSFAY